MVRPLGSTSRSARLSSRAWWMIVALAWVSGPLFAQDYEFHLDDQSTSYEASTGEATVTVPFRIVDSSSSELATGFSFGVEHDPAVVSVVDVQPAGPAALISGGQGPDFFQPFVLSNGFAIGVIWSLLGAPFDYAATDELMHITYDTVPSAFVGQGSTIATSLEFVDTLGNPPVEVVAVVDSQFPFVPLTFGATLTFTPDGFRRGDCNADGTFNIADAVSLLTALFVMGTPGPGCPDACDANDDGALDISDPIFSLSALFTVGSPAPASPYPDCGADPTPDGLICLTYPCL